MPYNRSSKEDEYFAKVEADKLRTLAEQHRREMEEAERDRLKEMHWMRCPKCGMGLEEIEFRGIKIDKCFTCGGMYFDEGEFDQVAGGEAPEGFLAGLKRIFSGGAS